MFVLGSFVYYYVPLSAGIIASIAVFRISATLAIGHIIPITFALSLLVMWLARSSIAFGYTQTLVYLAWAGPMAMVASGAILWRMASIVRRRVAIRAIGVKVNQA